MSYSANNNQNFFVQSGRTTSRVLNTPGGECSIALGGYTPAELERMRQLREGETSTIAEEKNSLVVPAKENNTSMKAEEASQDTKETVVESATVAEEASADETNEPVSTHEPVTAIKKGVSSNAFASSSTTNSFNVLTDRPTSRVTNPPGGKDNLWF